MAKIVSDGTTEKVHLCRCTAPELNIFVCHFFYRQYVCKRKFSYTTKSCVSEKESAYYYVNGDAIYGVDLCKK